jgi:hypothetical protein
VNHIKLSNITTNLPAFFELPHGGESEVLDSRVVELYLAANDEWKLAKVRYDRRAANSAQLLEYLAPSLKTETLLSRHDRVFVTANDGTIGSPGAWSDIRASIFVSESTENASRY